MADLFLCWIPSTTHINDLGEKHETRDSHHAEETNDWHHLSSLGKVCLTIWVLCSHRKCQGSGPTDNVLHLLPDVVPKVLADCLGNANAVIAGVSVEKPAVSTAIIYTIFLFISNQAGTRSVQQTKYATSFAERSTTDSSSSLTFCPFRPVMMKNWTSPIHQENLSTWAMKNIETYPYPISLCWLVDVGW